MDQEMKDVLGRIFDVLLGLYINISENHRTEGHVLDECKICDIGTVVTDLKRTMEIAGVWTKEEKERPYHWLDERSIRLKKAKEDAEKEDKERNQHDR